MRSTYPTKVIVSWATSDWVKQSSAVVRAATGPTLRLFESATSLGGPHDGCRCDDGSSGGNTAAGAGVDVRQLR